MRSRVLILAAMFLFVTACGGGDDTDDAEVAVELTDGSDDGGDGSGEDPDTEADSGSGSSSSSDVMSVFPLPPGEWEELFPYNVTDDDFVYREQATFQMMGTDVETVIAFYQDTLPGMGYDLGEPLQLGESQAISISSPTMPNVVAVVQAGPVSPTDPTIQLNQERTENKEGEATTETGENESDAVSDSASADEGAVPLDQSGDLVVVDWSALPSTPYFEPDAGGDDPYFHIHTNPESDGFFLSFELHTVWGEAWTGQTGTFDITCSNPGTSTGICPYFDADGPGPEPVIGDDFGASGSMTIVQLDDTGYEIVVHQLLFSDGTSFDEFTMIG